MSNNISSSGSIVFIVATMILHGVCVCGHAQQDLRPQQRQWKAAGQMEFHHLRGNVAIINAHQVLVIGGYHHDSLGRAVPIQHCEVIDVKQHTVQSALPLNVPHAEAALVQNGDSNLVVIGGVSSGNKPTDICEYYDRFYRSWRQIGKIRVPRIKPLATFISNEEILICGGNNSEGAAIASCEVLNIKTGQSTMVAPLPSPVLNAICFVSTVFQFPKPVIIASECGNPNGKCLIYAYNEKKKSWESPDAVLPRLDALRYLRLYDQRTVVWGNHKPTDSLSSAPNVFIENFTGYRPVSGIALERTAFGVGQWNNDTLLVVGGVNNHGQCDSATVWIDMLSQKHTQGPVLASPRKEPLVLALPVFSESGTLAEKCLVILGGKNGDNSPNTTVEMLREIIPVASNVDANEILFFSRYSPLVTFPIVLSITAGTVGCFVLALLYLVRTLRVQLQREQEYVRTEQEKKSLDAQIATLRLQTLQLQMKPHFVYNSLAAVESLVMDNKAEQASYYIRILAKLFRTVLEHSDYSTVKILDAIEFLKVYIALEQLRMDYTFDYDITHSLSTSQIQLYIPSMLIQPYIENSVKYGLGLLQDFNAMNPDSRRQGKLLVDFSITQIEGKEFLLCVVEDNGVGRVKAKAVYSKSTFYQGLSRSTRVNEERLSLLSKLHLQIQNVQYVDLHDDNGVPVGTRVILHIPLFVQQHHE